MKIADATDFKLGSSQVSKIYQGSTLLWPTGDADAAAFIAATGITDQTIIDAIEQLVTDLKTNSLWTKFTALYPFVGGTATTHKFNLIDPQDTNAAFRLNFQGGWTHSANGVLSNGSTGYADTFVIPTADLTLNSTHISVYCRTNNSNAGTDIGVFTTGASRLALYVRYGGSMNISDHYNFNTNRLVPSETTSSAFFVSNRENSTSHKIYKNGSQVGSANTSASDGFSLLDKSIYIGAANNNGGGATLHVNRQYALASIGAGFTDGEAATFYTIVQTFQTSLSRQI